MLERLLLIAALLIVPHAGAATGVELPGAACRALETCRVVGQGTLRWWGFHVYDAVLWSRSGRWQAQAPYALDIRYARNITGAQLAETSIDEMRRLGIGDAAAHRRWGEAMRRLFPDVAPGSRLIGLHRPGQGADYYSAAGYLGTIDDPEFARGFFAIWLDPRTQVPDLRMALLGRGEHAQ